MYFSRLKYNLSTPPLHNGIIGGASTAYAIYYVMCFSQMQQYFYNIYVVEKARGTRITYIKFK
jgi:hypothetical protein